VLLACTTHCDRASPPWSAMLQPQSMTCSIPSMPTNELTCQLAMPSCVILIARRGPHCCVRSLEPSPLPCLRLWQVSVQLCPDGHVANCPSASVAVPVQHHGMHRGAVEGTGCGEPAAAAQRVFPAGREREQPHDGFTLIQLCTGKSWVPSACQLQPCNEAKGDSWHSCHCKPSNAT
jgi:hypothetical protein